MSKHPTPVFFMSHGSTMMLGEDSAPARFWATVGAEAQKRKIKGIVWMGSHWETPGEGVEIAANPGTPKMIPVSWVNPDQYKDFEITVDTKLAAQVKTLLESKGISAKLNPKVPWIHDTFLVMRWMFGTTGPSLPSTVISCNAHYDPWQLLDIGAACRDLRYQDILIIGTGGAVHNLYRNKWSNIVLYRDNFAQDVAPEEWAMDFRTAVEDAFSKNSGPNLRRAIVRLMRHPQYREAQATDDHWAPAVFVAGAAGAKADIGTSNRLMAECWELVNMVNSQIMCGTWD